MKNLFIALLVLLTSVVANAQKLSEYKFVVVPTQFTMQKEAGQYNLNQLVASTFRKFDFVTMIEGDTPPVGFEPCKALKVSVNKRGFLKTYISYSLKDCYGKTVHTTIEGYSAEKDFQKAYYEAFRGAFDDPYIQAHQYNGSENSIAINEEQASKSRAEIIAEAKRQLAAEEAQERLEAQQELNIKTTNDKASNDYTFEFLGTQYDFKKTLSGFDILTDNSKLGAATKLANGQYSIKAGALSGKGFFDAFGNFVLKRINPINQKEITDTLARIK